MVDEHVDLGRPDAVVRLVDQRRVEAELAQPGQRPEDRDPVLVEVVDAGRARSAARAAGGSRRSCGAAASAATSRTCSCLAGRSAATSSLVRRSRNGRIRRRKRASTSRSPSRSTGLRDRLGEPLRPRVEPGRHDRQQRPQLHQPVLHRRAGEREPEGYVEPPHAPGRSCRWWFLTVCASSSTRPPQVSATYVGGLEPEQRVGRDHHVGARPRRLGDRLAAPGLRLGHHPDVEAGREVRGLARPQADHAGRRDHEERRGAARRGRARPARGSAASCRAPCRRRGSRRARTARGRPASGSPSSW